MLRQFRIIAEDFPRLPRIVKDWRRFPKTNQGWVRPLPNMPEEPSKHLTVLSSETANIKKVANLTRITKNYGQIKLNIKPHSDPLKRLKLSVSLHEKGLFLLLKTKTLSCPLLLRIAMMDMNWILKKMGFIFSSNQKLISPYQFCFLYWSILFLLKGRFCNFFFTHIYIQPFSYSCTHVWLSIVCYLLRSVTKKHVKIVDT